MMATIDLLLLVQLYLSGFSCIFLDPEAICRVFGARLKLC